MRTRWLLVVFLVGAAILTVGAFSPVSAEQQWQEWSRNIYRTETEHFVFFSHVNPDENENDVQAVETVARAEEFYEATMKYVANDRFERKLGFFLEMADQNNWLKDKQVEALFGDPYHVTVYPFGGLDHAVSVTISRLWLRLKLLNATPPEWLDYGLTDYIYWRVVENKSWADLRGKIDKMEISTGPFNLNTMANPTTWSRKMTLTENIATAIAGFDPYRMSIFYYLEARYGADKVREFLDRSDGNDRYDSTLSAVFAPRKTLESDWRLFVLFDGVSKLKWQESRSDYRTQQPGVEIRLKKGKTFWYNARADEGVNKLARSVGATNEILGLTPTDPRKIPVVTVEFNDRAEANTVKQSGSGMTLRTKGAASLHAGADAVAELYVGQAMQRAALKTPQWVGEGLKSYLASQAGSFEVFRLGMDGCTIKPLNEMNTLDDSKAIASLFWFVDAHYGHKAVAAMLDALSSGSPLDGAISGATAGESAKIYRSWIRALVLPEKPLLDWKETQTGFEAETSGLAAILAGHGRLVTISQKTEALLTRVPGIMDILKNATGFTPSAGLKINLVPTDGSVQSKVEQTGLTIAGDLSDEHAVRLITQYWINQLTGGRIDIIPAWLGEGLTAYVLGQSNNEPAKIQPGKVFTDFEVWKKPWNPETKYTAAQSDSWAMAVRYIIDRYGASGRRFFVMAGQNGAEAALKEALATDFDTLVKDWQAALKK